MSIPKCRDLSGQIEEKEAESARLKKQEKAILQKCGKIDPAGMQDIQKQIAITQTFIQQADERKTVLQKSIATSKRSFQDLLKNSKGYVFNAIDQERIAIRPEMENRIRVEIAGKTGKKIHEKLYAESKKRG